MSTSFHHDALFNAARTGNIMHLELLSAAGADFAAHNYDKVLSTLFLHVSPKPR